MQINLNLKDLPKKFHKTAMKFGLLLVVYILTALALILTIKLSDEILPAHNDLVESEMEVVEEIVE